MFQRKEMFISLISKQSSELLSSIEEGDAKGFAKIRTLFRKRLGSMRLDYDSIYKNLFMLLNSLKN